MGHIPSTDFTTRIGSVVLPNPIMTASGTSGQGAELSKYFDLSSLGAIVVKSLHAKPWPGSPAPRLHPTSAGMINSVGLQGPGIEEWLINDLPALEKAGARVIVSIWGQTVEEFEQAAKLLAGTSDAVIAVEVNASCPNLEDRTNLFAHSAVATAEVVKASLVSERPCWAKLSSNTPDLPQIAKAAEEAGAEAVTVANTLLGMVINTDTRKPLLGAGRGGVSGPAIKPIAIRSVFDTYASNLEIPIIGVGGIAKGEDVSEFLMAGATATQIGTATFANPRAPQKILKGFSKWCKDQGLDQVNKLIGVAHG